jgi:hypothetical protein
VTKHLSAQGRLDPRGGLCCFWCPNKNWNPWPSDTLTIIKNELEMRKLQPLKIQGAQNSKNKSPNTTKTDSQTPKNFFVCCSVIIRVQK